MKPPTAPAATAVMKPAIAASGSSESFHGIGIQTWDQRPFGRQADRSDQHARDGAVHDRAATAGAQEDRLHQQRLDDVEREVGQWSGPRRTPTMSARKPRITRKPATASSAPPRPR